MTTLNAERTDSVTGSGLHVTGLTVRYGGNLAIDGIDLSVAPGEIVGLIGANGAGKTTTIDAICGFVPHTGHVMLDGRELDHAPPHQRSTAGLARTWQSVELFADLTVAQNCQVSAQPGGFAQLARDVFRRGRSADHPAARLALEAVGLADRADDLPGALSLGQRKLAGVARALAAEPRIVLLDEPAAGLDQHESEVFGHTLARLVDEWGVGALLVDHDTRLVFETCSSVVVLDFGRRIAAGTPAEVRTAPAVVAAYLGALDR